jgi:hypothetical protein
MTSLRFITIEFMDGSTRKYSFPEQSKDVAAKQIKLEDFFKSRSLVMAVEGRLTIFPIDNIKSIELSTAGGDVKGVRVPAHTIHGAALVS